MKIESIKCDVCGKVKEEANKWIRLYVRDGDKPFICITRPDVDISFDESAIPNMFNPVLLIRKQSNNIHIQDICSDTCLYKRLGQVLTLIRDEPPHAQDESSSDKQSEKL